jgi:hypothetical protein
MEDGGMRWLSVALGSLALGPLIGCGERDAADVRFHPGDQFGPLAHLPRSVIQPRKRSFDSGRTADHGSIVTGRRHVIVTECVTS